MRLRFAGTFEELQKQLISMIAEGKWIEVNANQKQFRHNNGGILNWYPSNGTLVFQGQSDGKLRLEEQVKQALSPSRESGSASSEEVGEELSGAAALGSEPILMSGTAKPRIRRVSPEFLGQKFATSELVLGLVAAVGTELDQVRQFLTERLAAFGYSTKDVRVSKDIIPQLISVPATFADEYTRIDTMMTAGDDVRQKTGDASILALGAAAQISLGRQESDGHPKHRERQAYIINSLKHPAEVARLREIYPEGFFLIGVHGDEGRRKAHLNKTKRMSEEEAKKLMARDQDEHIPHGQRTSDTFHLSDFFVRQEANQDRLRNSIWRILDILFGHPYCTPTFSEYAMFMAFAASLRSADLSRQVGAVVAQGPQIISSGANDCPRCKGGLYWPLENQRTGEIQDIKRGRDYMRGVDTNKMEQQRIIESIIELAGDSLDHNTLRELLNKSQIGEITEYGRVVHAEMEALLACARCSCSTRGGTLYCTTFPCHNCAKHIIAAGISCVIYVEPYSKSRAADFHDDSIVLGFNPVKDRVHFVPFVGVGPRRFFDLFSTKLGSGYPIRRKDEAGRVVEWKEQVARHRIQMLPCSYLEREILATSMFDHFRKGLENE